MTASLFRESRLTGLKIIAQSVRWWG